MNTINQNYYKYLKYKIKYLKYKIILNGGLVSDSKLDDIKDKDEEEDEEEVRKKRIINYCKKITIDEYLRHLDEHLISLKKLLKKHEDDTEKKKEIIYFIDIIEFYIENIKFIFKIKSFLKDLIAKLKNENDDIEEVEELIEHVEKEHHEYDKEEVEELIEKVEEHPNIVVKKQRDLIKKIRKRGGAILNIEEELTELEKLLIIFESLNDKINMIIQYLNNLCNCLFNICEKIKNNTILKTKINNLIINFKYFINILCNIDELDDKLSKFFDTFIPSYPKIHNDFMMDQSNEISFSTSNDI